MTTTTLPRAGRSLADAAPRSGRLLRGVRRAVPALVPLGLLALVELCSRAGIVLSDATVPPPTTIAGELVSDVQHGAVWSSVWSTLRSWGIGMLIVVGAAVPLGLLLGSSRLAYHSSHLLVEFLRTIPSIAALPFLILIYGASMKLAVVLVVLSSFWPLLIQTMYGVHDVDPVTRETGRVYGLSRIGEFRRIVLPSALPYIATGLRLAGVLGLIMAIAASLIAGGTGLGLAIAEAQDSGEIGLMWARIVLAGFMGLTITLALTLFERRALKWHPSQRKVDA